MKKIILFTTVLLSSIDAYAVCTPPTTLKCECAHPIIENGVLACGSSYCGDKKCMPDGSCCESEKYCESSVGKQCCSDGQTCDSTNGCKDAKDIESLCANATGLYGPGYIVTSKSGTFCSSYNGMDWYSAEEWCQTNGMTMPSIYEICPSWDGNLASPCPENPGDLVWTATTSHDNYVFYILGETIYNDFTKGADGVRALCW